MFWLTLAMAYAVATRTIYVVDALGIIKVQGNYLGVIFYALLLLGFYSILKGLKGMKE